MSDLLYREESYAIRGAIFAVYMELGNGYLEPVYQECLEQEFGGRGVPFTAQPPLTLSYRGRPLQQTYIPDFVCFGRIIVELKAVRTLTPEHHAQLINYLKTSGLTLGFLVNFGHYPGVQVERFVR